MRVLLLIGSAVSVTPAGTSVATSCGTSATPAPAATGRRTAVKSSIPLPSGVLVDASKTTSSSSGSSSMPEPIADGTLSYS